MASNQPTTGREVLPAGIDVRKIRKPLNDAFASIPIELIGEGAATSTDGRRMSFTVLGEDTFYIRLDNVTTVNGTYRYAWTAMAQDRDSGNWTATPRTGNATTDDWATEINNTNLTTGTGTRYPARVNPQTGRVTFFFRNRGNVPPVNPCVDGICSNAPSSLSLDFSPPITATSPDNWIYSPGYSTTYPTGSPYEGCTETDWFGGYTHNAKIFREKMLSLSQVSATVSAVRNNCTETRIDVKSDLSGYMPKLGVSGYGGPPPFGGGCPQISYTEEWDVTLNSAERVIETCLYDTGSCGFSISVRQWFEFNITFKTTQITYEYGPFGVPIGSTSTDFWYEWDFEFIPGTPGVADPTKGDKVIVPTNPDTERAFDYTYAPFGASSVTIPCDVTESDVDVAWDLLTDSKYTQVDMVADIAPNILIVSDVNP